MSALIDADVDFKSTIAGNQWLEPNFQTIGLGPISTPQFQHVTKPACGDQRDGRAFALKQSIDGDGTAVDQSLDVGVCSNSPT